jgi:hypothetical protein
MHGCVRYRRGVARSPEPRVTGRAGDIAERVNRWRALEMRIEGQQAASGKLCFWGSAHGGRARVSVSPRRLRARERARAREREAVLCVGQHLAVPSTPGLAAPTIARAHRLRGGPFAQLVASGRSCLEPRQRGGAGGTPRAPRATHSDCAALSLWSSRAVPSPVPPSPAQPGP